MRTNVEIDDELMAEAMKALGAKTKREAIERALRDTIRAKRQLAAFDAIKGLGWEGNLNEMRTSKYVPADE